MWTQFYLSSTYFKTRDQLFSRYLKLFVTAFPLIKAFTESSLESKASSINAETCQKQPT